MRVRGSSGASPVLAAARRVLLVRLDNMGDVVLLSPAVASLREEYPGTEFTLLASPAGAQAAPLLPGLDRVIEHRASWQQLTVRSVDPRSERDLIGRLSAEEFDAAVVFTSFSQSAVAPAYLAYLAGIPIRAAYSERGFSGEVITHAIPSEDAPAHQAERATHLLASLGVPVSDTELRIKVPRIAREEAAALLESESIDAAGGYVAIVPGASAPARRYDARRFASVAARYAGNGYRVVLLGSEREAALAAEVERAAGAPVTSLAGRTSVPVMAALIEGAGLVVANNSLALHLADALGVPVVTTYAGTDPASYWGPRRTANRLLTSPTPCAPCFRIECDRGHECLDIDPRDVVAAGDGLLELVGVGSTQGRLR